jgi:hypothetical protein
MKASEIIKTKNVTDVIAVTQNIGDTLATQFEKSKDLKVAQISLSAYKTAIGAAKAQVIYKKLTGNPQSINFFK